MQYDSSNRNFVPVPSSVPIERDLLTYELGPEFAVRVEPVARSEFFATFYSVTNDGLVPLVCENYIFCSPSEYVVKAMKDKNLYEHLYVLNYQ